MLEHHSMEWVTRHESVETSQDIRRGLGLWHGSKEETVPKRKIFFNVCACGLGQQEAHLRAVCHLGVSRTTGWW